MTRVEARVIALHEDAALFREAVNFTQSETSFSARLVEKDYFCSVLLEHLSQATDGGLVFKGGTCLAKVYAEFYRLSEDLDFVIPTPVDATRTERSRRAEVAKKAVAALSRSLPCFPTVGSLKGANSSTQYLGDVQYVSRLSGQMESIKIEIGLREPLLTPAAKGQARTLLLDPVSGRAAVPTVTVSCISMQEAMAEKFRAALTRREAAIRDFYDIEHAVRKMGIRVQDARLVGLVKQKLEVPGNESVNVSDARLAELRGQLQPRLRPVLRERDFAAFDLQRAFSVVAEMARKVS